MFSGSMQMRFTHFLRGLAFAVLLLLAACMGRPAGTPVGQGVGFEPGSGGLAQTRPGGAAPVPGGVGAVVVSVDWPARRAQYLPANTLRFDLVVLAQGVATPAATASIVYPNKVSRLEPIPAGTATIEARAYDQDRDGNLLASGTVSVQIKANEVVSADLTLDASYPLTILGFSPVNGIAGDIISVDVKGVVNSAATAKLGSTTVAITSITLNASGDGKIGIPVPLAVASGAISISSDGQTRTTAGAFTRIASVTIAPPVWTATVGATKSFVGVAFDAAGSTISEPVLDFLVFSTTVETATETNKFRKMSYIDAKTGAYTPQATGSDAVIFGRGSLTATASVTVD